MTSLPEVGDHLVSRRIGYSHHGLFVGDERVIHYAGNAQAGVSGPVEEISLARFADGHKYYIKTHTDRKYSPLESISRAKSRIGESNYCVWANNCEHFIGWCINDDHYSGQVATGSTAATGAIAAVSGGVGIGAVSATGAVAGLSGSGITSGLAAVGATFGGGAVVGLAALAAAPGAITTAVMSQTLLKDNPALTTDERDARFAGRVASGAGAAAATVGGVVAVSTMGATAGLSAAGVSSGLAAIGASTGMSSVMAVVGVGGGAMAGGVVMTIAAPAVAAAAIGYGIYQATKWVKRHRISLPAPPLDGCQLALPVPIADHRIDDRSGGPVLQVGPMLDQ
jgi:hypothetical protein